jgi:hypothetical protein
MTEKELTTLVINKIDGTETFEAMKAANQVNEDELYLVGGDGEAITGVKGDSETSYRTGKVNITKDNIGLGNVDNTSDANKPVSTAQQTALDKKVDKVTGKGLSSNDYTNEDKEKLDGIAALTNTQIAAICETGSTGEELEKIIVITNAQIDAICGGSVTEANGVSF